jgi:hypothetical protein
LSFAIIFGNSIALAVFLRKAFLVKKSTYLLVNLTIADLLVGVSYCIFGIFSAPFGSNDSGKYTLFVVENSFIVLTTTASVLTLSAISVEKVFAVFWPFHHRLAKRWHYFTAIGFVWLFSVITFAACTVLGYTVGLEKPVTLAILNAYALISLITILVSYLSIWIKMTLFTKFRRCRTIQENSKLTKTLFIVTLVSLGTWLPKMIIDLAFIDKIIIKGYSPISFLGALILLFSNSFLNLVVYLFRMPEFRRELRNMFCKC